MKQRKPNRHPYWDYSSCGAYFVTICTKNRKYFLGEIIQDKKFPSPVKMELSEIGKIVHKYWLEIPNHFSGVKLLNFVVMPNHLHGILWVIDTVGDANFASPTDGNSHFASPTDRTKQTIPKIIQQYKRICTIECKKIKPDFAWQRSYHDRIVRTDEELKRIQYYINQNPQRWYKDRNNRGKI